MSDFPGVQIRVNLNLSGTIDIVPLEHGPSKPTGGIFTFSKEGGIMTGTFSGVNAPPVSEQVTALSVVITVAGMDRPAEDITDLHAITFPVSDGDLCVAIVSATNATGTTAGDPIAAVATVALPAPSKPTGGAFTFSA